MARRDEYQRHLKSPEWAELRDLALVRTSGFCQYCGNFAANVHHVKYPKQFGEEHPHSLIPVCERCHDTSHGVQRMKALKNVEQMQELSPNGGKLKYLLSNARVYASAPSWARALQVPKAMDKWFTSGLSRVAMLKKDLAGGELEMSYLSTPVYRWHAVAEQLRIFDRSWYEHEFKSRPKAEQKEIEKFHENYERLISWGYDLQERALATTLEARTSPTVTQDTLLAALKQAVAPRLRDHDDKLREHDVVIGEIKQAIPALRDSDEFVTVKQAISEQGLDSTTMPLHPHSRENFSALAGRMLKERAAEQGESVVSRLDGQGVAVPMGTYRRREIYAVLGEITRNKQKGLPL